MFGFITSTMGKLFGTDAAAKSLVDNVSSGLDKLVYTNQEKADDQAKAITEARTMIVEWLKATSGQNLSRRIIALSITFMWFCGKTVSLLLPIAVIWINIDPDKSRLTLEIINESTSDIGSAMMLILGFYFAAPYMGNIVNGALEKFGKKN